MRSWLLSLSCAAALAAGAALAQTPSAAANGPITGVIKSVAPDALVVTTSSGDVTVGMTAQTRVLKREAGAVGDIKPGAYLGTSNQTASDGVNNTATEVHVMSNGPNVEQQMDPQHNPGLMMTNGHVTSVKTTDRGAEMDVDYGGAAPRHVVVPQNAAMSRLTDVGASALQPGEKVMARTSAAADGKLLASFVLIGAAP
jgi:hypothetical protein